MFAEWRPMTDWRPVEDGSGATAGSVYRPLRDACPVHHSDELFGGFWAVVGHKDLVRAAMDTSTFSNVVPLFSTRRPPLESDPPEHSIFRG